MCSSLELNSEYFSIVVIGRIHSMKDSESTEFIGLVANDRG